MLGLSFKENCPDIRNSKIFDLIDELKSFNEAESQYLRIINEYPSSVFSEPIRFHIRKLEQKNL